MFSFVPSFGNVLAKGCAHHQKQASIAQPKGQEATAPVDN